MSSTVGKSMAKRADVLACARSQYGTVPEVLWPKYPNDVVLRHNDGTKWYAIIMQVRADKFDGLPDNMVDVMNLKCQPDVVDFLLSQDGIFPAYHMNKMHWISVILDGRIETERIFGLLDFSYGLTVAKSRAKKIKNAPPCIKYGDVV